MLLFKKNNFEEAKDAELHPFFWELNDAGTETTNHVRETQRGNPPETYLKKGVLQNFLPDQFFQLFLSTARVV